MAEKALAARGGDVEAAIDDVVALHIKLAAAGGFVTGLGGFITLPANVVGFYGIATRMVASASSVRVSDWRLVRTVARGAREEFVPQART